MTALSHALEIPDDAPRQWRRLPLAVVAAAAWLVVGVVIARTFALGGMERRVLLVGALLAIPAGLGVWLAAGPHRFRTAASAIAMVLGVALIPLASAGATPSTGRLAELADSIGLPGTTIRDRAIGNGRCRPACSELRRTAVVDGISIVKVRAQVVGALKSAGYEVRVYSHAPNAPQRIDAGGKKVLVSLELRRTTEARTTIAAVFLAQGPAPDHEVGPDL